jgi:hypothetical protein
VNIIWEYPFWVLVICLAAAVLFTGLLYYKNSAHAEIPRPFRVAASVFRFLALFLIALILFSPLFRTRGKEKENPILLIIQDNSQSIVLTKDSTFYKTEYLNRLAGLRKTLGENYETAFYTAGEILTRDGKVDFSEKQTDYEQVFRELESIYAGRNIGAILFAGDGLYNKGINPTYRVKNLKAPVFAIAMGDSSLRRDAFIRNVHANKLAYLNNKFPVEINVGADKLKGKNLNIKISSDSKILFSQSVTIQDERFDFTLPVYLDADKPGIRKYTVSIEPLNDESTLQNNVFPFYVEVIDGRRKILLLAEGPHPDLGAIRQALSVNENFESDLVFLSDFTGRVEEYSLVIMYQLPGSGSQAAEITSRLEKSEISTWYILGSRSNLFAFNQLNAGLKITNQGAKPDEITPYLNTGFGAFTLSEKLQKLLSKVPPLFSPYGNYETQAGTETVFYRKIGLTPTQSPALLLNPEPRRRIAILAGEGIWRWGLEDFEENKNREQFNELISKIVQYLAVTEDKSRFRVNAKNLYPENENIVLDAELYNESYELINTPEASLMLKNKEGKSFPYQFSKTETAYRLDMGKLPAGDYSFNASVQFGGKKLEKNGSFSVSEINVERLNTRADFSVMMRLANETDGEFFPADQLDLIPERIRQREDIRPITYVTGKLKSLSDFKWLFAVILALLAGEWFIRKYFGSY